MKPTEKHGPKRSDSYDRALCCRPRSPRRSSLWKALHEDGNLKSGRIPAGSRETERCISTWEACWKKRDGRQAARELSARPSAFNRTIRMRTTIGFVCEKLGAYAEANGTASVYHAGPLSPWCGYARPAPCFFPEDEVGPHHIRRCAGMSETEAWLSRQRVARNVSSSLI